MERFFIKNYQEINEDKVRLKYGVFAGIVGIISNIFLVLIKITIGLISGSISILANAIDSLSDAISSIITLISFRLSGKDPDAEHPFGHERIEYIAGLILSFFILFIGINLMWTSINKIKVIPTLNINYLTIIILVISIIVKIWQSFFYRRIGKKMNSIVVMGASKDAFNDILTTTAVLISIIVMKNFSITMFNLDALMGAFISIFIIFSGIKIFKEAAKPLIGTMPDALIVDKILDILLSEKMILGYHDMVVHSYGPNRIYCSIHLEFDYHMDILVIHEIIDSLEKTVNEQLNIELVIHMDPVVTDDEESLGLKERIVGIIKLVDSNLNIHDFRLVKGKKVSKVIFDCEIPNDLKIDIEQFKKEIAKQVSFINPKYQCIIVVDKKYIRK